MHFEETPLMSTYLLAFVVGQFDYVEGHSKDGVQLRVYTPLGKKESGHFALRVAGKLTSSFSDNSMFYLTKVLFDTRGCALLLYVILWHSLPFGQDGYDCRS